MTNKGPAYTYDNIDRLKAATGESYGYDVVGNRTSSHLSSTYTITPFNRVTASTSATYSYNANGSMTGKVEGANNWTYAWDRENRLVSATSQTGNVVYQHDALGRRVKRIDNADTDEYTFDGLDVLRDEEPGHYRSWF